MNKTVALILGLGAFANLTASGARAAEDELASVEELSYVPEVFLVSSQQRKDCAAIPGICLYGNGGGTVSGVDVDPTVGIVTTLVRGTQVAGAARTGGSADVEVWHLEMIARFRMRTASAPIVVAVMDYADPEGMSRKEATAVWQISSPATNDLGLRMALTADDGFRQHHTYLIRIVQSVGTAERVLAEKNVLLK